MIKLITEVIEAYTKEDFNYKTEKWENIQYNEQNYFTIVADTQEEAEILYNEIDKLFICSKCPDHEKENCDYDDKYTIADTTEKKIDKRKLKKYL